MDVDVIATFVHCHDLDARHVVLDPAPSLRLNRFPYRLCLRELGIDELPTFPERDAEFLFQCTFPNLGLSWSLAQKALFHLLLACLTSLPGCISRLLHMHNTSHLTLCQYLCPPQ